MTTKPSLDADSLALAIQHDVLWHSGLTSCGPLCLSISDAHARARAALAAASDARQSDDPAPESS